MIPRVYVAGASRELERCQKWIALLNGEGIRVTYDWTKPVEKYGSEGSALEAHQLRMFARNDLRGIDDADIVWVLAPEATTVGAWVELGYAINRFTMPGYGNKRIVISPPISARVIFARLPVVVECATDDVAFEWIQRFPA
jgi:hypothetical protein